MAPANHQALVSPLSQFNSSTQIKNPWNVLKHSKHITHIHKTEKEKEICLLHNPVHSVTEYENARKNQNDGLQSNGNSSVVDCFIFFFLGVYFSFVGLVYSSRLFCVYHEARKWTPACLPRECTFVSYKKWIVCFMPFLWWIAWRHNFSFALLVVCVLCSFFLYIYISFSF